MYCAQSFANLSRARAIRILADVIGRPVLYDNKCTGPEHDYDHLPTQFPELKPAWASPAIQAILGLLRDQEVRALAIATKLIGLAVEEGWKDVERS